MWLVFITAVAGQGFQYSVSVRGVGWYVADVRMRRRIFFALIVLVAAWLLMPDGEPRYKGRKLSSWLKVLSHGPSGRTVQSDEAEAAVSAIGTNAIPFLLNWFKTDPQRHKWAEQFAGTIEKVLPRIPAQDLRRGIFPDDEVDWAFAGFAVLRERAAPAIPELCGIVGNKSGEMWRRELSADIIGIIGESGLDALQPLLFQSDGELRRLSIHGISCFCSETNNARAAPAIPILIEELKTPGSPSARDCASILGRLRTDPQVEVPALMSGLTNSDIKLAQSCAYSIGRYGNLASNAVPELRRFREIKGVRVEGVDWAIAQIVGTNKVSWPADAVR